jgi:hypothetical protein
MINKFHSKIIINTLRFAILFASFLFCSNYSFAQNVKISVNVDSTNILIGDQINLNLSATYNPQKYRVQFPLVMDSFNHFEVVERGKVDTLMGRDENTFQQKIQVTNFDSGQWLIPSFQFEIQDLIGGEPSSYFSDSILISVNTVAVDTAKPFKPIMSIRSAKMPWYIWAMYIGIGVLVCLVLAFLIWYFVKTIREKNKKPEFKEPEIVLLPHEKALRALQQIKQDALWQQEQEKLYHTQLTDVVRNYLEEQFGLDCLDKTSSEIIQQVKRIKALATSRQPLRTIFEVADMVKFAKSKPTLDEHEQSLVLAEEFILESYKRIKPIENPSS